MGIGFQCSRHARQSGRCGGGRLDSPPHWKEKGLPPAVYGSQPPDILISFLYAQSSFSDYGCAGGRLICRRAADPPDLGNVCRCRRLFGMEKPPPGYGAGVFRFHNGAEIRLGGRRPLYRLAAALVRLSAGCRTAPAGDSWFSSADECNPCFGRADFYFDYGFL